MALQKGSGECVLEHGQPRAGARTVFIKRENSGGEQFCVTSAAPLTLTGFPMHVYL